MDQAGQRPINVGDVITVFVAQQIRTMEASLPEATAVAVRDGLIVEVGTLESLKPWLDHNEHVIDERFADQVLMPGFIDPHVHPALMSLLLGMPWIPPENWDLPGRPTPAARSREEFLARLGELVADGPSDEPLIVFGYHAQFHGEIVRSDLDTVSLDRPIVLWQRSFHELRANSAGLEFLNAAEGAEWDPHIDMETGRLYESGMVWGLRTLNPIVFEPATFRASMGDFATLVQQGGITTIVDAGTGNLDREVELAAFRDVLDTNDVGFRTHMLLNMGSLTREHGDKVVDVVNELITAPAGSPDGAGRLGFVKAAKFFADGAFIAQLMQVGGAGYIDGHPGAWMVEPAQLQRQIERWWDAGFDIHIHTNGDLGVDACLDAIDAQLHRHPRFDHRTTLHHFGVSTSAQARRMAALGCHASANGYYLHLFGEAFADQWLGTERASQMTRLGSVVREGSTASVHSDVPMGPLQPLLAASTMATRRTVGGTVMGEAEALTPEQALRTITIDAAFQMRLDHQVGSIAAGKAADFVALDADPLAVDPGAWPQIGIVATVLGGTVFPNQ